MVRPKLCDFNYAYIHVKTTITVPNIELAAAAPVKNTKKSNI